MANLGSAPPTVPGTRWQPDAYATLAAYEAMEAAFGGGQAAMRALASPVIPLPPPPRHSSPTHALAARPAPRPAPPCARLLAGNVSIILLDGTESNALALTGPLPVPSEWPSALPAGLQPLGASHAWRRDVYPLQTSALPADAVV